MVGIRLFLVREQVENPLGQGRARARVAGNEDVVGPCLEHHPAAQEVRDSAGILQIANGRAERARRRSEGLAPEEPSFPPVGWPHDTRLTTLAPPMEALAHIATPEFAVAFGISFVAAAMHSTVGFGFSLLSVPLLSLLNPLFAPVPQLLVVWPLTLAIVWRERHAVEVRSTLWIFAGRIPGAVIGVALLKLLSNAALDVLMSLMVIVGVALVVSTGSFRRTPPREFVAGVASGTMAMVSAIGGPPIALLYRNDEGPTVRANLGLVFAIGLTITITVRAAAGEVEVVLIVDPHVVQPIEQRRSHDVASIPYPVDVADFVAVVRGYRDLLDSVAPGQELNDDLRVKMKAVGIELKGNGGQGLHVVGPVSRVKLRQRGPEKPVLRPGQDLVPRELV